MAKFDSTFKSAGLLTSKLVFALIAISLVAGLSGCDTPQERSAAYIAKAEQFFEEDNLVKAELEVRNALQIEPKNPDARFLLARISESRQDYREMVTQLRAAIEARPEFLEARIKLGTIYVLAGALDLAEEQYTEAAGLQPSATEVRVLYARILAAQGDLEGARVELEAALAQDPANIQALGLLASVVAIEDPEAALEMINSGIAAADDSSALRLLKIQLLQRDGKVDEVVAEYRTLISEYPDIEAYRYQLARFLAAEGRTDEVEQVLGELVEARPDDIQAKLALVQFVGNSKGQAEAEKLLETYVAGSPGEHQLSLALALVYQAGEKQNQAIEIYNGIIEDASNSDEAMVAKSKMAAIYLTDGDIDAGKKLIDEILSVDSMNAQALLLSGALNFDQNNLSAAIANLRTLLRNDPENTQAQIMLARTHAKAGDDLLAKDAYRRVLEMDPDNSSAPLELIRLLVKDGDLSQAEDILKARISRSPGDINASRALIALYIRDENLSAAEKEALRIGKIPGNEAIGSYLQGSLYQSMDQHEKAIAAFQQSLQGQPNAREPLQGLVSSYIKLDRSDTAIAYLKQVVNDSPENLYAQTLLGQVLAGSGELGAAQALMESTLSSNQEWLPAYTTLAGMQSGNVEAQIDIYKRGLEAMPTSQELALLLGTAYEREGKIEDAISAYEKVLASDPELPAVANNLAALLADYRTDNASLERALKLVENAERTNNPAFIDTLGWVHYRMGNFEVATPLLRKSVDLAAQVPVLRYHLGMAYFKQNKYELAEEQLTLATEDADADYTGRDEAASTLQEIRSR